MTSIITKSVSHVWSKLKSNFVKQPWKVTINNIIKELPSVTKPLEATYGSLVKAYTVTIIKYTLAPLLNLNIANIEKDSTHEGAFVQNVVSGNKNLALWWQGVPRGTRNHTLDRVASDYFLKGGCKIFMLQVTKSPLMVNILCEGVGYAFVDAGENIQNKNANYYELESWKNELSSSDYLIDVTRKAASSAFVAKIVMGFVKPTEHSISNVITSNLPKILGNDYASTIIDISTNNLQLKHLPYIGGIIEQNCWTWISGSVLMPGVMNILKLIPIAMIIVPSVRVAIYTVNEALETIVEHNGETSCMKIGDVFAMSERKNITIDYKYDAHKVNKPNEQNNFICKTKKGTLELAKSLIGKTNDAIVVHYPKEEDLVGKAQEYMGSLLGEENIKSFISSLENIGILADQIEDGVYSALENVNDYAIAGSIAALATGYYFFN
jgi:hypothetical protein